MPLHKDDKEFPIYRAWVNMRYRCNNPVGRNKWYVDINYDPRWESFDSFYNDMKTGWKQGLTIERIDSKKDYSRDNCRWATIEEQMNNKSDNRSLTLFGKTMNLNQWARFTGIKRTTIRMRIDVYGWTIEQALTKKVRI